MLLFFLLFLFSYIRIFPRSSLRIYLFYFNFYYFKALTKTYKTIFYAHLKYRRTFHSLSQTHSHTVKSKINISSFVLPVHAEDALIQATEHRLGKICLARISEFKRTTLRHLKHRMKSTIQKSNTRVI